MLNSEELIKLLTRMAKEKTEWKKFLEQKPGEQFSVPYFYVDLSHFDFKVKVMETKWNTHKLDYRVVAGVEFSSGIVVKIREHYLDKIGMTTHNSLLAFVQIWQNDELRNHIISEFEKFREENDRLRKEATLLMNELKKFNEKLKTVKAL